MRWPSCTLTRCTAPLWLACAVRCRLSTTWSPPPEGATSVARRTPRCSQALSDHVLAALEGRRACLMANHGLLCLATDLARALALALEVEQLARSYLQCLAVGEPVILDDAEMDRVLEKFKDYGP